MTTQGSTPTAVLTEYKALRDEILQRQKATYDILIYSILATGAILGYGFTAQRGYVFLVPFAILIPLSYGVKKQSDIILIIGSYISTVIEEKEYGLRWESFLYSLRKFESRKKGRLPRLIDYIMIYDFLSISSSALALVYWNSSLPYLEIILVFFFLYFAWWNIAASRISSYQHQNKIMSNIEQIAKMDIERRNKQMPKK